MVWGSDSDLKTGPFKHITINYPIFTYLEYLDFSYLGFVYWGEGPGGVGIEIPTV
jgi:hypothetical protein